MPLYTLAEAESHANNDTLITYPNAGYGFIYDAARGVNQYILSFQKSPFVLGVQDAVVPLTLAADVVTAQSTADAAMADYDTGTSAEMLASSARQWGVTEAGESYGTHWYDDVLAAWVKVSEDIQVDQTYSPAGTGATSNVAVAEGIAADRNGSGSVNLELGGFVLDGVTDEGPLLSTLLGVIGNTPFRVPEGKTLFIDTAVSTPHFHARGKGKILMGLDNAVIATQSMSLHEIEIDANSFNRPVELLNDNGTFEMDHNAWVHNVEGSAAEAIGVMINGAKSAIFRSGTIEDVRGIANAVLGDTAGAATGIVFSGSVTKGLVLSGMTINDINSRDSVSGNPVFEDGDGVKTSTKSGTDTPEYVAVIGVTFTNCGKRAAKFNGTTGRGLYIVRDCTIDSAWLGTPDGSGDINNGMATAVSCYNGDVVVQNNTLTGGAIGSVLDCAGDCASALVEGNRSLYESHEHVQGKKTTILSFIPTANTGQRITVTNNTGTTYCYRPVYCEGAGHIVITDNDLNFTFYGAHFITSCPSGKITGNKLRHYGANANASGVIMHASSERWLIIDNETIPRYTAEVMDADSKFRDFVTFSAAPTDTAISITVSDNSCRAITREVVYDASGVVDLSANAYEARNIL